MIRYYVKHLDYLMLATVLSIATQGAEVSAGRKRLPY